MSHQKEAVLLVKIEPIELEQYSFIGIEVNLPKTNLLMISAPHGYVMCGALDIQLLRNKLAHREIIAARAVGVKTMDELLNGVVESCTQEAERIGIQPNMSIREALLKIAAINFNGSNKLL